MPPAHSRRPTPSWYVFDPFGSSDEDSDDDEVDAAIAVLMAAAAAEVTGACKGPQGPKFRHLPGTHFSWEAHVKDMPEAGFKQRYRLTPKAFYELRDTILPWLIPSDMEQAELSKGYVICANTRLAVGLRIMAGGDPKDLMIVYQLRTVSTCYAFLWKVVDGVNACFSMELPTADVSKLSILEAEFRAKSNTAGQVWRGQVTAVDGVLFKQQRPPESWVENGLRYYVARKSMYAILCIAGCDAHRRFQFYDISQVSTTHDSMALYSTEEGQAIAKGLPLSPEGYPFFANGDSAFRAGPSMVVPSGGVSDAYDWCQSSNRMCIECAFGILVRRWGILWKPLAVRFDRRAALIGCLMRLHNFCIDKNIDPEAESVSIDNGVGLMQPGRWRTVPRTDKQGRPVDLLTRAQAMIQLDPMPENPTTQQRLINAIKDAGIIRPPLKIAKKKTRLEKALARAQKK